MQHQERCMDSEPEEMQLSHEPVATSKVPSLPTQTPFGNPTRKVTVTMGGENVKLSFLKKQYSRNPFKWVSQRSSSDAPKRPMSSYNMFFLLERERLVRGETEHVYGSEDVQRIVDLQKMKDQHPKRSHRKSHGKISFHDLSREVAKRWKTLDASAKEIFNQQANIEKMVYKKAMDEWILAKMRGTSSSQPSHESIPNHPPTDPPSIPGAHRFFPLRPDPETPTMEPEWPRMDNGPLWYDAAVNWSAELAERATRHCLHCRRVRVEPPDFHCTRCLETAGMNRRSSSLRLLEQVMEEDLMN